MTGSVFKLCAANDEAMEFAEDHIALTIVITPPRVVLYHYISKQDVIRAHLSIQNTHHLIESLILLWIRNFPWCVPLYYWVFLILHRNLTVNILSDPDSLVMGDRSHAYFCQAC